MTKDELIDSQNDATYPFDEPQEGDEGYGATATETSEIKVTDISEKTKDQIDYSLVDKKQ